MTKLRIGTLLVALVAVLALASTALAQGGGGGGGAGGGGGGGGASCAGIVDFAVTPGSAGGQPTLTTSYTVDNGCFDLHKSSAAALDTGNSANSFAGRAVTMLPLGPTSYTSNAVPVTPGVTYTTTLTVYAPNGKVAATQTIAVAIPLA